MAGQGVVLEAQGIRFSGGGVEPVGQVAGLGAAAPVAGAAADQGAHGALAGIAHAKRPVSKGLHLCRAVFTDGPGVLRGAFPGQYHPLTAIGGSFLSAAGGKKTHLGAGVKGQVRQRPAQQVKEAPVLHQHTVHPQAAGLPGGFQRGGQLPVRHQRVESEEHPHAPFMTVAQGLGKFLIGKVFRTPAGIEFPPAQIHGAGAVLDRGPQRFRRAGGGEQFRPHPWFFWSSFCWRRKTSRLSSLTSAWALPASSRYPLI